MVSESEDTGDSFWDRPSKSSRKRDMTALQKTGQVLVEEGGDRIASLGLPDTLIDAIKECRRLKSREAIRRQLQYVGRLMRSLDEETIAGINEAIDSWRGNSKADTALMHATEAERAKLLETDAALTAFVARHPGADVQTLRNLIRNARREAVNGKPPKSSRELYKIIRELLREKPESGA